MAVGVDLRDLARDLDVALLHRVEDGVEVLPRRVESLDRDGLVLQVEVVDQHRKAGVPVDEARARGVAIAGVERLEEALEHVLDRAGPRGGAERNERQGHESGEKCEPGQLAHVHPQVGSGSILSGETPDRG